MVLNRLLFALACLLLPSLLHAQPTPSHMELRAQGFLSAFSSGDPDVYKSFRDMYRVPEATVDSEWREKYLRLYKRFGLLEPRDVLLEDERTICIFATAENISDDLKLTFTFQTSEPYLIEAIQMEVGAAPRGYDLPDVAIDPGMNGRRLTQKLDAYLGELAAQDVYSGVTFIARDGDVLYNNGHGMASKSFEVPNTPQTRFRVGSLTKGFTKVAAAQLVAAGKIHPDDPVAVYFPDYPNRDVAEQVTVDMLLRHTSGLGGMNFPKFRELSSTRFREPSDFFELFADQPLLFAPGTNTQYSNAGYIVMGAIISAASGMSYFDYIEQNVFKRAGMKRSGFFSLEEPHDNIAVGYWKCRPETDEWCNNYYVMSIQGGPSGGSYSTAEDLYRFDQALRDNRLLPREYTQWFFTGEWPSDAVPVAEQWPELAVAGGAEGVSTVTFSNGEWFIAVLCNYDEPIAEEVGKRLHRALVTGTD